LSGKTTQSSGQTHWSCPRDDQSSGRMLRIEADNCVVEEDDAVVGAEF
jgi:hypothetical protein